MNDSSELNKKKSAMASLTSSRNSSTASASGSLSNLSSHSSTAAPQPTRKKLMETSAELKRALSTWEELSRVQPKLSADEQMLQEIKGLLSQLKNQLDAFE